MFAPYFKSNPRRPSGERCGCTVVLPARHGERKSTGTGVFLQPGPPSRGAADNTGIGVAGGGTSFKHKYLRLKLLLFRFLGSCVYSGGRKRDKHVKIEFFKHSSLAVLKNICFMFHPGISMAYWKLLHLLFLTSQI